MTRTEWFPASAKPVRYGVYECLYEDGSLGPVKRLWTGSAWDFVDGRGLCLFGAEGDKWRGLTRTAYLKAGGK